MSFRLQINPRAAQDMRSAKDWYDDQQPGLGREFVLALDVELARI